MIVIAIIGILAAALFPAIQGYLNRAHENRVRTNISTLIKEYTSSFIDLGYLPGMSPYTYYMAPLYDGGVPYGLSTSLSGASWKSSLRSSDFSVSISQPTPVIAIETCGLGSHCARLANADGKDHLILEWYLPGLSDYTGTNIIVEPYENQLAMSRCRPGKVRFIHPAFSFPTVCHIIVE